MPTSAHNIVTVECRRYQYRTRRYTRIAIAVDGCARASAGRRELRETVRLRRASKNKRHPDQKRSERERESEKDRGSNGPVGRLDRWGKEAKKQKKKIKRAGKERVGEKYRKTAFLPILYTDTTRGRTYCTVCCKIILSLVVERRL